MPATGQKSAYQSAQTSTVKILYGESDEQTLSTQCGAMTKAGHHVTTALNRQGVLEALRGVGVAVSDDDIAGRRGAKKR